MQSGTNTELSRRSSGGGGGLARYRSAPATWLEALLESEDEQNDVVVVTELPKQTTVDSDLEFLESTAVSGGLSNFLRQNSSPAEFLNMVSGGGGGSDGYFSSLGIPADFGGGTVGKRAREAEDLDDFSRKLSSSSVQMKIEEGAHLQGEVGGSLDAEMDRILEDSVMCRTRAKRGCATHPRSIAERVRRTRISDRIRKLQDLVPNMDRQTNTADMLDEAVEYVKFLQKQIQELMEHQRNCTCSKED